MQWHESHVSDVYYEYFCVVLSLALLWLYFDEHMCGTPKEVLPSSGSTVLGSLQEWHSSTRTI